jgi:dihydrofolate reductase
MRRLGFYLILTADGLYEDADGGLGHYDPAEDEHRFANDLVRSAGDLVYGRVMYDVMTYWDSVDVSDPEVPEVASDFATVWRSTPKHVISRGQPTLGPNASILEGDDVVAAVRRLKEQPGGDIGLGCGAELFATLSGAGLIDDYRFLVTPMALGAGKSIWASLAAPLRLRLTGSQTFSSGTVLLEYVPETAA